ncbi:hypothetical protein Belba_0457 [Belliella baltica DSM 15883]|uniref:Secreted protein n=1 Tax=Belliella baltica (strain DSM 15883 / CIP 108006 / LMG 21964 / BA134) TaxID=866536 RepID=I3Z1J8_BELBD|nr:hypothetical protein [Belliella baltica]AFL83116.1 hypothetical protein Belba_0457 [Belliella baltica DSM 15883]
MKKIKVFTVVLLGVLGSLGAVSTSYAGCEGFIIGPSGELITYSKSLGDGSCMGCDLDCVITTQP